MLINVATTDKPQKRVLVLAAGNHQLPDLDQLGNASDLSALGAAGHLHIDALVGNVSEDELAQALFDGNYSVFHAALHGDRDGLALTAEFLERERLGELLQVHGIALAVLLSCESEAVARRVAEAGVCCVIGTTVKITNDAAYNFCLKFYRHLLRNNDATTAYEYARRLLKADYRAQFVLLRAEDCQSISEQSPYQIIDERLARIEAALAACKADTDAATVRVLRLSTAGHQEITAAMLQLVGLFQGLLGERHDKN